MGIGLAAPIPHPAAHCPPHIPPHIPPPPPQDNKYDYSADAWGLGVLVYELASGVPPFYAQSIPALLRLIAATQGPPAFPPSFSPELVSFLSQLLVRDPAKRAGWDVVLRHPFLVSPVGEGAGGAGAGGVGDDGEGRGGPG
jgi:serine/threonine protein kinase